MKWKWWFAAMKSYLKDEFNKGKKKGIEDREKIKNLVMPQKDHRK